MVTAHCSSPHPRPGVGDLCPHGSHDAELDGDAAELAVFFRSDLPTALLQKLELAFLGVGEKVGAAPNPSESRLCDRGAVGPAVLYRAEIHTAHPQELGQVSME